MNQAGIHIIITITAFALLVGLAIFLKREGIVRKEDVPLFARLMTVVVLPGVIFFQLITHPPALRHVLPIVAMLGAGGGTLLAAWAAAKLLGLSGPKTGALMIVSAFGSSSLLGYPMIQYTFPNDPEALTEAILISELAVGLPIFLLCPIVAMHYGEASETAGSVGRTLAQYFRSPIFIAVVLGLLVSQMHTPLKSELLEPVLDASRMIEGTLAALACLILGLQIEVPSLKTILPLVGISAMLQMGLQPLLAYGLAVLFDLGDLERQVLVLVASLPSAVLGPVFAARYKCEGEMASAVTFANILLAGAVVPLVFMILGR
jgi:malate permease and related proteins